MRSGSLVLSFFKQQRLSIRPREEKQNWPTWLLFTIVPLQRPHTCGLKGLWLQKTIFSHSIRQSQIPCGYESNEWRLQISLSPAGQRDCDLWQKINYRLKQTLQLAAGCSQLSFFIQLVISAADMWPETLTKKWSCAEIAHTWNLDH